MISDARTPRRRPEIAELWVLKVSSEAFILIHIRERFLAAGESKSCIHKTLGYLPHKWCFYRAGGGLEMQNVPIPHQECISPIHKSSPSPPAEWRRPFSVGHWGERGWERFSGPRRRHLWETTLALNTHTNSAMCCGVQTTVGTNVSEERPTHHASSLPPCVMAFEKYLCFRAGQRVSRLKYPYRHWLVGGRCCEDGELKCKDLWLHPKRNDLDLF